METKEHAVDVYNTFKGMGGTGDMSGFGGGGLMGIVALMALLGRNNGLLGGNGGDVGGVVTPALLASSLADVTSTMQATNVQQTLGDIKASIPLAEGQVQLALAGAQADINSNINAAQLALMNGQAGINKNVSDATGALMGVLGGVKETVLTTGTANLMATKDSQYAVTAAIGADGEKTRALIARQYEDTLNRQLTEANNALLEQRAIGRSREVEVNVTQNVNQQQAQFQQQQQIQGVLRGFEVLANQLNRNQQDIINLGTMTGNSQTAANTNVR